LAISNLNTQLETLNALAVEIKKPAWLDGLSPSADGGIDADPMDVPASVIPGDATEISMLYGLFAAHPFNEGFQQYEQLKRLKLLLEQRGNDLRAMREMAGVMNKRQAQLPGISSRVEAVQNRLGRVADRWPVLEKRSRQSARDSKGSGGGNVSIQTMERQFKLTQMDEYLAKQPASPAVKALQNRIRTLRGLVLMENASKAPASQEQIYADLSTIDNQLRLTQLRMEALQQLLADNQKVAGSNNEAKVRTLETRLAATQKSLDKALDEYRSYLRVLAENQLEDTKDRINNDLAEAHLSIARLQDAALVRDAGAVPGKPQP
ncbi:MAG TPA: hypothetical protein VF050_10255, partial [Moraxellaceae bacterium]